MKLLESALAACLLLVMCGVANAVPGDGIYAKPGRLVSTSDGARLNVYCMGSGSPAVIFDAAEADWSPAWATVQPQVAKCDYSAGRAARRFAGTPLRCLVTGFVVSAASNNCRIPCSKCSTAFSKAPSCPTRTIATNRYRSNDGGRNTFTGSIE